MKPVALHIPVLSLAELVQMGSHLSGVSVYRGVLVVWDEDFDTRIITLINELFARGKRAPFAICESKGSVTIMWHTKGEAAAALDDYEVEGDLWPAQNLCLS